MKRRGAGLRMNPLDRRGIQHSAGLLPLCVQTRARPIVHRVTFWHKTLRGPKFSPSSNTSPVLSRDVVQAPSPVIGLESLRRISEPRMTTTTATQKKYQRRTSPHTSRRKQRLSATGIEETHIGSPTCNSQMICNRRKFDS